MASIPLPARRARPRPARLCTAIVTALTVVVVAVPATEAKKNHSGLSAVHSHGKGKGKGAGHNKLPKLPKPGKDGRGKVGKTPKPKRPKEPTAQPAITEPPPSTPAKPAPSTTIPSTPTQSPTTTSPVRTPNARKHRRRSARRHRRAAAHRTGSTTGRVAGANRGSSSASPASSASGAGGSKQTTQSGGTPSPKHNADQGESPVTRTVHDIVKVIPNSLKAILAALAALTVLLGAGSLFSTLRARRLDRQRRELLQEVGLLQSALLPPVPDTVGALRTSVAYRPADGSAAGGDFYDAFPTADGKAVFILGDVSGHGRGALERTAFLRYTLRAYLEAGLAPRVALQVAGRIIDEHLGSDFATVMLAVHDPASGSLTYACAGHPAPIVVGPSAYEPVLAASAPPVGMGLRTGLRQTTVPLAPGSVACLYTDGLTEARTAEGILGRTRLADLVGELGRSVDAPQLLERLAEESRLISDDMAVCLLTPTAGVTAGGFRTELLELSAGELDGPLGRRFLEACGVPEHEARAALDDAEWLATRFDQVVLHVVFGNRMTVEVLPANVESIEVAARRGGARKAL